MGKEGVGGQEERREGGSGAGVGEVRGKGLRG